MTAITTDTGDLRRWAFSAAVVIALHAALVATLTTWHERLAGDEGTEAIVVDLAPFTRPPTESRNDLAPGPEQQQSTATPEQQLPKTEEKPEEKTPELPPVPNADVQLPVETKPEKPVEQSSLPAPATSPPKPRPSAAQIASWHRKIALQVERHKGYPAAARALHETGIAELAFTLDRSGRVVTSRVVRSSGFASLDQETIDTVRRAQPFPPPPSNMEGQTFDFTVPIRFNIR